MDNTFSSYKIDDRSLVAFIKREIHNLALEAGFSTHRAGETDIIVSELTSNLIKYADGGELLYRINKNGECNAIEIYCLDNGPGIFNLARIMNDGYSSGNTLGHGLGAIKRLSNQFHIYSLRGWGTVQYVNIYAEPEHRPEPGRKNIDFSTVSINCPGEKVCGDGYHIRQLSGGTQIFVGDGLGHGPNAYEAVQQAIVIFKETRSSDPVEILRTIHDGVKKTRGLVGTIASLDFKTNTWHICGIGNINTRIYYGIENKTYTPYNGIIGHNIPRTLNSTVIPYIKHQLIIMHSDGLRTRWNLNELSGILKQEPGVIAASLYKDNVRGNDDATVLVGKVI